MGPPANFQDTRKMPPTYLHPAVLEKEEEINGVTDRARAREREWLRERAKMQRERKPVCVCAR
jgi:hypothetical protein